MVFLNTLGLPRYAFTCFAPLKIVPPPLSCPPPYYCFFFFSSLGCGAGICSSLALLGLGGLLLVLPRLLGLAPALPGHGLLLEGLDAVALGLHLVDLLHEDALVLELVTLGEHVKLVVNVRVNLLGLPVLLEHPPEHAHPAHPDDLEGETGVGGTAPLSVPGVASLPLRLVAELDAGTGVDGLGLLDDLAVLDGLADVLAGVQAAEVAALVRVHPHLALAALEDGGREALLQYERNHIVIKG
mmetsp:Transcript_30126/g.59840  ORF Transcript_30126/g.59840 Transcript_30126/m.59840 type:complete len:242 (+) Transcript_30126:654-1379(+)